MSDPLYSKKLWRKSRVTNFGNSRMAEGTETGWPGVDHNTGIPELHKQPPCF
jgi:hypothetical protein